MAMIYNEKNHIEANRCYKKGEALIKDVVDSIVKKENHEAIDNSCDSVLQEYTFMQRNWISLLFRTGMKHEATEMAKVFFAIAQ
jgi:hypothetical protein